MNENTLLSSRVAQLESDMKHRLQDHQKQTSETQATITSLHNRQMADRYMGNMYETIDSSLCVCVCVCVCVCNREAIGSLMAQLQDLRSSCATEEAKVSSLRRELYDTSKELGEALSRNNRQVSSHTPPV